MLTIVIAACGGGDATDTTAAGGTATTAAGTDTTAAAVETTVATETTAGATDTTAGATDTTAGAAGNLVIWADELRAGVIEEISPAFTDATGVGVEVQIVDFGDIRTQVTTQAPAGEGPDLFIGANDWTGELAANGVIEPVDLGSKSGDFFELSLTAFSIDGQLYAVPYGYEAIALYYNTDLVPEPPASIEDAVAICEGLPDIENCIGLPGGGDAPDAYHHYPFISAGGGYIFRFDPATGFDPSDVGLDTPEALAGVEVLQTLVDDGVIGSTNYDTAKNLFLEGSQPFWITGPWELGGRSTRTSVDSAMERGQAAHHRRQQPGPVRRRPGLLRQRVQREQGAGHLVPARLRGDAGDDGGAVRRRLPAADVHRRVRGGRCRRSGGADLQRVGSGRHTRCPTSRRWARSGGHSVTNCSCSATVRSNAEEAMGTAAEQVRSAVGAG